MTRVHVVLALLLACSGPTTPSPAPAQPRTEPADAPPSDDAETVRMDGYGALRFGMDLAAVESAIGEPVDVPRQECHVVTPKAAGSPAKFTWLVHDGVLTRIDVTSPAMTAKGGGRVGMHADELRKAYAGSIVEEPHKYDPRGQTWTVGPVERAHFVFELDASARVVTWRAGVPPQVDWVERCG